MPRDPTPDGLAKVVAMLPDIERLQGAPVEWGGGPQPDGSTQLGYAVLAPAAERLRMALYDHDVILHGFAWMKWKEADRFLDPANLASATLLDLRRLFTYHVRQDRFVEGHFGSVIANGQIAALLRRLAQLVA
jgi:hypothetical protein